MVKKLTKEVLDEFIEKELEIYLSKNSIKRDNLRENQNKYSDVEIWVEYADGTKKLYEDTEEHKEYLYREQKDKAIKGFQTYYRSLNTDQRYELVQFLKPNLIKKLTLDEIEDITSRVIGASKGLTEPQNKNRKPK